MRAIDKLRASWSKSEDDLMYHYPAGSGCKADMHLLHNWFMGTQFTGSDKNIMRELDARGYDITTLKFSIEPKKANQKFHSQREETNE